MSKESKAIESQKQEIAPFEEQERTRDRRLYIPRTDIYETDEKIVVLADIPGADEKSIEITLEKNVLTIRAYPGPEEPENYGITYAEYGLGDFERSFTISNEIDRDKIEAAVKSGVLTLNLPKASRARTQKIAIKSG